MSTYPKHNVKQKIAVYARKSKVTESGKSTENQINKCIRYAALKWDAGETDIAVYCDEGLSGFYADRPEYMRMLRDIAEGKIKAVICYKFDRISRRTIDLMNLVDQLRERNISFISCSDDIDTSSKTGKIVVSLLASLAEFERDIIAERIADNMAELAKDGRWLGGVPPAGFRSRKEYYMLGGKKKSIYFLHPEEEEISAVKMIFRLFLRTGSLKETADYLNQQQVKTVNGRIYTPAAVKNILANPVYSAADAQSYDYLMKMGTPIYAQKADFNGQNGIMAYNKTRQIRQRVHAGRTADPLYVQKNTKRKKEEWIVAVGRHPWVVRGADWVWVQQKLEQNKSRFSQPRGATQALLSGILCCPECGSPMYVRAESGRMWEGRARYHYVCSRKYKNRDSCPGAQNIPGNELDDYVLHSVCALRGEEKYYNELLARDGSKSAGMPPEAERARLCREREKVDRALETQTRNLREASPDVKAVLLRDMESLAREKREISRRLEDLVKNRAGHEQALPERIRNIIDSFPNLVQAVDYPRKLFLVRSMVEKVLVTGTKVDIYLRSR